ncbi:MAG: protoheme IX farnesyltransferase [Nitrospirae bacterium]|nr:protoheme IX farnesyltransferase [Nitrospirota bacterium]
MTSVKYWPGLCKIKISLLSAFSAATGAILSGAGLDVNFTIMVTGVFLLASGASALNQYQEREIDALMERTKSRPLPSGNISPREALYLSAALILSGTLLLLARSYFTAAALGVFAVVWYNGVYTDLKRLSAFAPVPGALVGAIPPAIGWSSAGGDLLDPMLPALCVFFFIWQVPHFLFLSLSNAKDYKKAGLPTISGIFSNGQIARINSVWILSMAVAGLALQLYIISSYHIFNSGLFAACLFLFIGGFTCISRHSTRIPFRTAFNRINMYMLLSMLILTGERLFLL